MLSGSLPPILRARGVTAVLGPTNTGKTYLAIERMIGHSSGMIGLPLRLLAREVYNRVVDRVGKHNVALLTGEEKIKPKHARYYICTVESMPRDLDVAFLAVDEIQLASDTNRGHVFTNALLNMRGREETLLIGSSTMKPMIDRLIPGANMISRPRLSKLSFAGERKITRLPPRSAIVAFSAEEVYAIAELIRRQRGGAAVVMGALSPRTRNAQVALFQSGEVDHIVATDAIGMGLNLEIDHVAFAAERKFDGYLHRKLHPAELAQIAGRAGRHLTDGTFGTTGRCAGFDPDLVEQLETHDFDFVRTVFWRNPELQFSSLKQLQESLLILPQEQGVARAPVADDEQTLEIAASRPEIRAFATGEAAIRRLWDVCALPDYRKVAPQHHADLALTIFEYLMKVDYIPVDWFAAQVALCNRAEGEIDTLSARLAQIRTWTFCANRLDWLRDPEHWQRVTRKVEDTLSDALHEKLAQRFVDRRTSVLMRRLRENAMLEAEVNINGDVLVEGQNVGKLSGFRFTADTQGIGVDTPEAKALRAVAARALASEIDTRAAKFIVAEDSAFALALDGTIRWQGEPVAILQSGEKILFPKALLLADDHLSGAAREQVVARLDLWLAAHVKKLLGPLQELETGGTLTGIGRGLAYQLAESLGVMERAGVANDVKTLDQAGRSDLRKMGVRFGSYHIYAPQLLKPAARALAAQLWMLNQENVEPKGLDDIVHLSSSGRTSFPADETLPKDLYRAAGFRVCGPRAVRVDILERLADLIRPAVAFRPGVTPGAPPAGATEGDAFVVTVNMTSLVGCSGEDFGALLKSLGYRSEMKPLPEPKPIVPLPGSVPVSGIAVAEEAMPVDDSASGSEVALNEVASIEIPSEVESAVEATEIASSAELTTKNDADGAESHKSVSDAVSALPETVTDLTEITPEPEPVVAEEESVSTEPETIAISSESSELAANEPGIPPEPVLIEIWKLARPAKGEGQHRNKGKSRSGKKDGTPHLGKTLWVRGQVMPDSKPVNPAREVVSEPAKEPRKLWSRDSSASGEVKTESGPATGKSDFRKPRPQQDGKTRDHQPRSGTRPDRSGGHERRSSGGGFSNYQSTPVRSDKQPDPDSPFAKLAALKAQMESK